MARFSKLLYIIGILAATCFTACTNDGDIGDLYGKWQMEGRESYINFEGSICQMQIVSSERHEISSIWAGFYYTTDSLFISVAKADYTPGTTAVDGKNAEKLLQEFFDMELPADSKLRFEYQVSDEALLLRQQSKTWKLRHYGF